MNAKPSPTDRFQFAVLIGIVLVVGLMAGAASFSHVHDWTMDNSPAGTGDWFGWANAVITELIPTAALIVTAKRRRNRQDIGYPMFLLVAAVGLSLTAQLAVAQPTVFGWMVSALPALAFFALSKLVFSRTQPAPSTPPQAVPVTVHRAPPAPTPAPTTPPPPAPAASSPSAPVAAPIPALDPATKPSATPAPAAVPSPAVVAGRITPPTARPAPAPVPGPGSRSTRTRPRPAGTPAPSLAPSTTDFSVSASEAAQLTPPMVPPALLARAAQVARDYHTEHGTPITAGQLAVRLKVTSDQAAHVLATLANSSDSDSKSGPAVNGTAVKADR